MKFTVSNIVNIIKTNVLIPQAYMTLGDFWVSCSVPFVFLLPNLKNNYLAF